ncbi:MAG: hypothetical protein A3J09_02800 [Candidatus Zambryskibacteria bacterium RIFCSPLOWO2_02_FULL_51_21]|uniref:Small ribosomal subunit protein bS6 n=1 Tax=Candidatus Zambryskibacteria bacterium RIFCSPHIGHO2_02_FULL_43_37 TaxID=1802749 RepID=A0A1G2TI52_9BACT|nr:MAG: hypothetical protein A2723_02790 [Candidatus Zambryskibacteria bacterium RIFCSPHIGHO2_01_FULL_52_18]OHA96291.1 MAG: hypothetical protein A3D49_00100 [Candidatus Zambryskibacteria bacterium RIFCSPHIGHO2_02_FULL_43_37]OHB07511.1 MAG: hypothetical protein A2944_01390 [Candidatus Zambryskibacteria bacterium RIFCSPLOWO2_01_FULL_52_12]OHB11450.1 MAG: hypothetical protein A3J09_02800 [Candidatus Zambryskibacteria bacterium RIFCSPLOWO2_02_FULL_51_21]
MQVYELGYLILPSIPEDGLSGVVEKIKGIIGKGGGQELDSESPVRQDLAYTMGKTIGASRYVVNDAYIGWVKFEAEPDATAAIKEGVEKVDEVLRLLIIKAPRKTSFTFAQARQKVEAKNETVTEGAPEEAAAVIE